MKYKTNKICDSRHFIPKSYVLKNTNSKSDNNKRILAPNDYIKQHFLCSNLMSWPGLHKSDNIKRMITLTVITLSGAYFCIITQGLWYKSVFYRINKYCCICQQIITGKYVFMHLFRRTYVKIRLFKIRKYVYEKILKYYDYVFPKHDWPKGR